jgi:hypothetical protein
MARHPDIMPGQHDDRDREDQSVEKLLADAFKCVRKGAGEKRDEPSAEKPGGEAAQI